MAKKIHSNHFQVKRTVEGTNVSIDFVPKVKAHTAPIIKESFIDDGGEVQHILENGNTLSDINYMFHWGKLKTPPNWTAKTIKVNPNPFTLK